MGKFEIEKKLKLQEKAIKAKTAKNDENRENLIIWIVKKRGDQESRNLHWFYLIDFQFFSIQIEKRRHYSLYWWHPLKSITKCQYRRFNGDDKFLSIVLHNLQSICYGVCHHDVVRRNGDAMFIDTYIFFHLLLANVLFNFQSHNLMRLKQCKAFFTIRCAVSCFFFSYSFRLPAICAKNGLRTEKKKKTKLRSQIVKRQNSKCV